MSESLDSEKQFFESLDKKLGQFYEDAEADKELEDHSLQDELKRNTQRFSEESFFASGATKKVYSVLETSTERKIALARPHKSDRKTAESFLREARRTSLLEHSNIVRIYDLGVDDQGPWFTMELIEGVSLQEKLSRLRDGREECDLYERLEIFNKICDAMTYAHSIGVLHLDIKPDNIRIGEFGEILLCDWGLSFLDYCENANADISNEQTLHGVLKGTPGYMAPERIKGDKSVQSDVFSLGALLFALLTYRPPFEGNKVEDVLFKTIEGKYEFPESAKVPERLVPVIRKALSIDLNERYKSVKDLQEEIYKYRAGFATTAEEPNVLTQLMLFYSRNRSICILALIFLIVTIGLTYRHIHLMGEKQRELQSAKQKTEEAFELYKKEEEARDEMLRLFSSSLIEQSRMELDSFNVENSLKNLNKALEKDPENEKTLMQLGFVHFIRQDFKLAAKFFSLIDLQTVDDLKELSIKLKDHQGLLSAKDLIELFGQLRRRNLHLYMYNYYANNQNDHQQLVEVTKYLIVRKNRLKDMNFVYDESKKSLSLADNPKLKQLFFSVHKSLDNYCMLKHLDVDHLDLSNTGITKLGNLRGLNLISLNLKGTSIKSLDDLKLIPSLRKVILSKKQKRQVNEEYDFAIVFE